MEKDKRVKKLIALTKSDSGVAGPALAKAHMELGELLAEKFQELDPEDTTIVAILRGGLFFAEGMYFKLGCKFQIYNPKRETFVRPDTKNVILVDAVINTGKTISAILEPDMRIAACVVNQKAVSLFDRQLYTIRTSTNSFVGSEIPRQIGEKGPDTTMRLFNRVPRMLPDAPVPGTNVVNLTST